MFLEHLVYTAAFAVLFGMVYYHITGRDPWWIMVLGTILPDADWILQQVTVSIVGVCSKYCIYHGDFHNILMLILIPYLVAKALEMRGYMFKDAYIYCMLGFAAHIFEDTLVYSDGYPIFYPITTKLVGIGMTPAYAPNFHGLWMTSVMVFGLILLGGCVGARVFVEGWRWMHETEVYIAAKTLIATLF